MLTGYENLQLHSMLYSIPRHTRKQRIDEVLKLVGLTERRHDQVKTYSGGMRRRLEIARGLLHKPKVMFLDEPTLGLDPASRETMWKYIQRLVREEKMTVILTTHYMEEADILCDRIGIIDKGRIVALDTPKGLKAGLGGDIIRIKTRHSPDKISQLDFVHKVEQSNGFLVLSVNNAKRDLPMLLRHVEAEIVEFASPTLNEVFIHLTGRKMKEEAARGRLCREVCKIRLACRTIWPKCMRYGFASSRFSCGSGAGLWHQPLRPFYGYLSLDRDWALQHLRSCRRALTTSNSFSLAS